MVNYDATAYLLDRANIQDTITRMGAYVDQHNWAGLITDVFAEELSVDYTELMPDRAPYKITGAKQAEQWEGMLKTMDKSQHAIRYKRMLSTFCINFLES